MERIPYLFPRALEPDVAQRATAEVGINPIRKDSLARSPELAGSGQHAAPVHPYREPERFAIFERHSLRRQLGTSVE